jgi:diguanylate cyclase (GGDEF)-like protein
MVANDSRSDPRLMFRDEYTGAGVRALAVLPLIVAGEAVGALALYAGEADFFHEGELGLLRSLADNVAFAIDHLAAQERLEHHAFYDEVTGLANRRLLLERIAQGMRAEGAEDEFALLLLDLERFRNINNSLGRSGGDALLGQVAKWLTSQFGDARMLARIGADHFAVMSKTAEPGRLAEESMAAMMEHPFKLDDAVFRVGAKVGIARFPADGGDAETLFRNAEAALKTAKARGVRYLSYAPAMNHAVAGTLSLENELRRALENGEFELRFAPFVSLASGKVSAAEACVWWNHPRDGPIARADFASVLEESGLVHELGQWAVQRAVATYLRWHASGVPAVRISLGVSAQELRHPGLIEGIGRAIAVDARAAEALEIEIPESLVMEDVKRSIASMQAVRALGLTVAIDNFGAGFSSLSSLARLPADRLKIDRSFIGQMAAGPQGLALVSTIIKLAHSLKLKVSAEGVETEEQSTLLRLLRCDEMQGPLPGKATSTDCFEELLRGGACVQPRS